MAASETLSVRINAETRRVLAETAATRDAAGASALAREILERWAAETISVRTKASIDQAVDYLRSHPAGWDDDPADFFRDAAE